MEHIETVIKKQEEAVTTLESLKQKDSELRKKLEEEFPDDKEFAAFAKRALVYLEKTGSSYEVGIERARAFAAARAAIEKMAATERGRLSDEFIDTGNKREAAEEEVQMLKHTSGQ